MLVDPLLLEFVITISEGTNKSLIVLMPVENKENANKRSLMGSWRAVTVNRSTGQPVRLSF